MSETKAISLEAERQLRVAEKIERELGTSVMEALRDPEVTEVALNSDGQLRAVGHFGKRIIGTMAAWQAEALIGTVASTLHSHVDYKSPMLECALPMDGSRFAAMIPPIVTAPVFTIRRKALRIISLADYVTSGIMTERQRLLIIDAVVAHRNILIVGGTNSGKTTLGNAVLAEISDLFPDERQGIIEETAELQCKSADKIMMQTSDNVTMDMLLRKMLRFSPKRITVGEVRGGEALQLLKAWNTGHEGGAATLHANTGPGKETAGLFKLEQLIGEVSAAPQQHTIAEAVNIIVSIAYTPAEGRRVHSVIQVHGYENGRYQLTAL